MKFDGTSDGVNQNLLALDSGTGIATGVGIEIADKNGAVIPLHTASMDYPSRQAAIRWTSSPAMFPPVPR
ncbi:fimbrial protein [Escherichia coli]